MATTDFRIGHYVIAEDSAYSQRGKITETRMSTGTRKGMLYKVGINYFFADEMKFDFEAMIKSVIADCYDGVLSLMNYSKPFRFRHKTETKTLTGLVKNDYFVYAVTDKGELVNLVFVTPLQLERMYNYLCDMLNITK